MTMREFSSLREPALTSCFLCPAKRLCVVGTPAMSVCISLQVCMTHVCGAAHVYRSSSNTSPPQNSPSSPQHMHLDHDPPWKEQFSSPTPIITNTNHRFQDQPSRTHVGGVAGGQASQAHQGRSCVPFYAKRIKVAVVCCNCEMREHDGNMMG